MTRRSVACVNPFSGLCICMKLVFSSKVASMHMRGPPNECVQRLLLDLLVRHRTRLGLPWWIFGYLKSSALKEGEARHVKTCNISVPQLWVYESLNSYGRSIDRHRHREQANRMRGYQLAAVAILFVAGESVWCLLKLQQTGQVQAMQGCCAPSTEQYALIWLPCQAKNITVSRMKERDRDPKSM